MLFFILQLSSIHAFSIVDFNNSLLLLHISSAVLFDAFWFASGFDFGDVVGFVSGVFVSVSSLINSLKSILLPSPTLGNWISLNRIAMKLSLVRLLSLSVFVDIVSIGNSTS